MEDFEINNTSVAESYNNNDTDNDYEESDSTILKLIFIENVVMCIIISVGLLLTLVAIYGLYSQVRNGHVAPIYVINLLISDIIQICSLIVYVAEPENYFIEGISDFTYNVGLMASVCFMVCVALERYLVVAWPLWYRFRRNIKTSVVVSVMVWIITLVFVVPVLSWIKPEVSSVIYAVFFLLPLPLFIFFLFGTIKALSAAISVPPDEKRRIVAILVLVLLIYTLLFLPTIILILRRTRSYTFQSVSFLLIILSPLADLFLYVFSKKGVADMFLARVCGCSMNSESDISSTTA